MTALGFTDKAFQEVSKRRDLDRRPSISDNFERIFEAAIQDHLSKESTFTRNQIETKLAQQCQSLFGADEISQVIDRFWSDPRIVGVGKDDKERDRFSTLGVLGEELRILFLAAKINSKEEFRFVFGDIFAGLKEGTRELIQSRGNIIKAIKTLGYEVLTRRLISSDYLRSTIELSCDKAGMADSGLDRIDVFKMVRNLDFSGDSLNHKKVKALKEVISSVAIPEELFSFNLESSKQKKDVSDRRLKKLVSKYQKKKGFGLTDSQYDALVASLQGDRLVMIEGLAGTGKTSVMGLINEAYSGKEGRRVLGLTPSHRAREELESVGIKSRVFGSAIKAAEFGHQVFRDGDVVVCDEMGMVGANDFLKVMELMADKKVKLILVGDSLQIAPVNNGAPFRLLLNSGYEKVMLRDVVRQDPGPEREAAIKIREGKSIQALSMLYKNGNLKISSTRQEANAAMVSAYVQHRLDGNKVNMTLFSNDDVREMNQLVRPSLVAAGLVAKRGSDFEIVTADRGEKEIRTFAKGDELVLRKNDNKLGLYNGTRGNISKIRGSNIYLVRQSDNKEIKIPMNKYKHVEYGYGSTEPLMQGATNDVNLYRAGLGQDLGKFYVGSSRHRKRIEIFSSYEDTAKVYFQGFERALDKDERSEVKHRAVIEAIGLSAGSEQEKYNALDVSRSVKRGSLWEYKGPDLISQRALDEIQALDPSMKEEKIYRALRRIIITPQGVNDKFQVPLDRYGDWQKKAAHMVSSGDFTERSISELKKIVDKAQKGIDSIHSELITERLIKRRDRVKELHDKSISREQGRDEEKLSQFRQEEKAVQLIDPATKSEALELSGDLRPDQINEILAKIYLNDHGVASSSDRPSSEIAPWQAKAFMMLKNGYNEDELKKLKDIVMRAESGERSMFFGSSDAYKDRSENLQKMLELNRGRGIDRE